MSWPRRTSSSVSSKITRSVPPYRNGGTRTKSGATWAIRNLAGAAARKCRSAAPLGDARGLRRMTRGCGTGRDPAQRRLERLHVDFDLTAPEGVGTAPPPGDVEKLEPAASLRQPRPLRADQQPAPDRLAPK